LRKNKVFRQSKWFFGLLVVLMLSLFGVAFAQQVELTFLTRFRSEEFGREVYNFIAEGFSKKYPEVKISYIDTTYDQELQEILLRAQGGTPPDLADPVPSWLAPLVEANLLEAVENYVPNDHLANFTAAALEDATFNGSIYGIPMWSGPICLFMNKDLAKQAGYGLEGPSDIFEFEEMIAKISSLGGTEEGQKIYGFALRNVKLPNTALWFMPWLWGWGGKVADIYNKPVFDSMGSRKALEFYQRLTNEGFSAKGQDAYSTRITFSQGRAGFVFDGSWLKGMLRTMTGDPSIDDLYVTCPVPKGWDGTNWSITNYSSLVVLSGSQHKKEAFDFVKYFTSDEEVIKILYEKMGMMPAHLKMLEASWCQDKFLDAFKVQNFYVKGGILKHAKSPGVEDIIASAVTQAVDGVAVDSIVKNAQKELEDLLLD